MPPRRGPGGVQLVVFRRPGAGTATLLDPGSRRGTSVAWSTGSRRVSTQVIGAVSVPMGVPLDIHLGGPANHLQLVVLLNTMPSASRPLDHGQWATLPPVMNATAGNPPQVRLCGD